MKYYLCLYNDFSLHKELTSKQAKNKRVGSTIRQTITFPGPRTIHKWTVITTNLLISKGDKNFVTKYFYCIPYGSKVSDY